MGRSPCCSKEGLNRGAWSALEDQILSDHIKLHGEGKWRSLPKKAGLKRCGKSCRLRWLNYLRPDIKRGNITLEEEDLIIRLHKLLGNRWSLIAGRLPGRTDNEIKNYWNTKLGKRVTGQSTQPDHYNHTEKPTTEPSAEEIQTQVVRAKPFRCTKVFVTSLEDKVQKDRIMVGDSTHQNSMDFKSCELPMISTKEDDSLNTPADFDAGQLCLSDILVSDFTHHSSGAIRDNNNAMWGNATDISLTHGADDHLLFNEEMLDDLTRSDCADDLRSLASFLNSEEEWFGEFLQLGHPSKVSLC